MGSIDDPLDVTRRIHAKACRTGCDSRHSASVPQLIANYQMRSAATASDATACVATASNSGDPLPTLALSRH
jgi:hypothetical protein